MTPNHRAQCIETMADALHDMTDDDPYTRQQELNIAAFILRRLHGIAFVNPIEATEDMIEAMYIAVRHHPAVIWHSDIQCKSAMIIAFDAAMAASGNLTNTPEGKP